jgi:hypothetical protein
LARVLADDVRAAEHRHAKLMARRSGSRATSRRVLRFDPLAEGVSGFADRGTILYAVRVEVPP